MLAPSVSVVQCFEATRPENLEDFLDGRLRHSVSAEIVNANLGVVVCLVILVVVIDRQPDTLDLTPPQLLFLVVVPRSRGVGADGCIEADAALCG